MMSSNDYLKAPAIRTAGQAGKSADCALLRLCQIPVLWDTQHWSAWQVMSAGRSVSGQGRRQEAALAEAVLFCLPFLIATATGSLLGVGAVPSIPLSSFK